MTDSPSEEVSPPRLGAGNLRREHVRDWHTDETTGITTVVLIGGATTQISGFTAEQVAALLEGSPE